MAYTPNPRDSAAPLNSELANTAAAEFRALKDDLNKYALRDSLAAQVDFNVLDFNTKTVPGTYTLADLGGSGGANAPGFTGKAGVLVVIPYKSGDSVVQLFIGISDFWVRRGVTLGTAPAWSAWARLWTTQQAASLVASFNTRTGAVTLTGADVTTALGYVPENAASSHVNTFNGRSGAVALTSGDVTAALGYTPAVSGAAVTSFNGRTGAVAPASGDYGFSQLSGTATPAQLGTGTPNTSTYLRGDGAWTVPPTAPVTSVAGKTGAVTVTAADVGLGSVINAAQLQQGQNLADLANAAAARANLGLGNVENKSSATIRGELTSGNVTGALGYTPPQPNGTGASGTWGISISGNAGTATAADALNNASRNGYGNRTVSTSTPSGGSDGDIWLQV